MGYAAGDMFLSIQSSGEWSISFEYEEGDGEWLLVSRSSGTGSTNSVILQYGANLQDDSRHAFVIVNFEDKSLRARLLQRGCSSMYNGGEGYQIPPWEEYPGLVSDVTRGWTELPQMKDIEGTAWVYHNLKLNDGKEFRNYSILYDAPGCSRDGWPIRLRRHWREAAAGRINGSRPIRRYQLNISLIHRQDGDSPVSTGGICCRPLTGS